MQKGFFVNSPLILFLNLAYLVRMLPFHGLALGQITNHFIVLLAQFRLLVRPIMATENNIFWIDVELWCKFA